MGGIKRERDLGAGRQVCCSEKTQDCFIPWTTKVKKKGFPLLAVVAEAVEWDIFNLLAWEKLKTTLLGIACREFCKLEMDF